LSPMISTFPVHPIPTDFFPAHDLVLTPNFEALDYEGLSKLCYCVLSRTALLYTIPINVYNLYAFFIDRHKVFQ
jgi:hypothetical protein